MNRNPMSGVCLGVVALLVAGWAGLQQPALGKAAEPSVPERMRIVLRRSADSESRVTHLIELAKQRDASLMRDYLNDIINLAKDKLDDLFVREAAIEAIGTLQSNVYAATDEAKNRYIEPFTDMLKDADEHLIIRRAVTKNFARTLKEKGLKDGKAFDVMLDLLEDPNRNHPKLFVPVPLRIDLAIACGEFGSPAAFKTMAAVLGQQSLDLQLREAVVRAIDTLLGKIENLQDKLDIPMTNKFIEIIKDKKVAPEIRSGAMRALGRLRGASSKTNSALDEAISAIRVILSDPKEDSVVVLVAAIEALGLAGDEDCLPALKKASSDFIYDPKDPKPGIVQIRQALMRTLGQLLRAMDAQKGAGNSEAVKAIAEILVKAIDIKAEMREAPDVMRSAAFYLRYLYPKKFEAHHKNASENLILLLKEVKRPGAAIQGGGDLVPTILKTLEAINGVDFQEDVERWEDWLDKKWPGGRVKKGEK